MKNETDLNLARKWFANDIGEVAPVLHNSTIIDAFATVRREDYLGAGPWGIHSRLEIGDIHQSKTTNPRHLYHDVLIAIDQDSGINNGLPSLWARVFDNLDIKAGASVLQVGAGVGYYTAILAELVSPNGHVIAYEIEPDLAKRAKENLCKYPNVEVICGDATQAMNLPKLDALFACAGVTYVPPIWLDRLKENGQLVLPYTGADQWGFLLHLTKTGGIFPVKSLGPVGAYHCAGARSEFEAQALTSVLKASNGGTPEIAFYHPGNLPKGRDDVWVCGQSYWISKP